MDQMRLVHMYRSAYIDKNKDTCPLLGSFVSFTLGEKKVLHVKKKLNLKGHAGKRYKRLGNQNGNFKNTTCSKY